jgi:hypothetical protein
VIAAQVVDAQPNPDEDVTAEEERIANFRRTH